MSDKQMPVITKTNADGTLAYDIPAAAAVPGAWINPRTGLIVVIKEVDGANITAEYAMHPGVQRFLEILYPVREEATDKGAQAIIQGLMTLGSDTPDMSVGVLASMVATALPWPTELALAQLRAGRQAEGFNGQAPQINVNLQMPGITLPEQPAPVVNLNPELKATLDVPPVETETISIERDSSGFISEATKVRRRGKQPAPA